MPEDMRPKACCKVGSVSVIENALRTYEQAGIRRHVIVVGRSADNQWYQGTVSGGTGTIWIFADTIQIVSGDPQSLPTVNSQ